MLEFQGTKLDDETLRTLSDTVRAGALEGLTDRDVAIMTRENMMALLKSMGAQECSEGDCEVETARNLGADFVISGVVARIEETYVVTLKFHESKLGNLLGTELVRAKTQLELLDVLRERGRKLASLCPTTANRAAGSDTLAEQSGKGASGSASTGGPSSGGGLRAWGVAAGALGLAAIGAGVTFSILTKQVRNEVNADAQQGAYDRDKDDRGVTYSRLQWVGYGVGGVALGCGVLLYYLGHRTSDEKSPIHSAGLTPMITPHGAGATVGGSF